MKFRERQKIADQDEQRSSEELRSALQSKGGYDPLEPPDNYWSSMLVHVNEQLDSATSGKALSLSWAARVAIPGVVAIISFYIGLHYYVPEQATQQTAAMPILASLLQSEIDSLLVEQSLTDAAGYGHETVFSISGEEAAQYCISTGEPSLAFEILSDAQVDKLLTTLTPTSQVRL